VRRLEETKEVPWALLSRGIFPRREYREPGWAPVIEFDGMHGRFEMAFPSAP
jgi:hypothetical protein